MWDPSRKGCVQVGAEIDQHPAAVADQQPVRWRTGPTHHHRAERAEEQQASSSQPAHHYGKPTCDPSEEQAYRGEEQQECSRQRGAHRLPEDHISGGEPNTFGRDESHVATRSESQGKTKHVSKLRPAKPP